MRLPNLERIKIDKVSDFDADLVNFLTDCIPAKLEKFWINFDQIEDIPIKAEFYFSSLLKAVSVVTEELFFYLFEFSAVELQSIIRAACNAKQIVIRRCSVHCSTTLDFGKTTKYKTNFLSFESWGYSGYKQVTIDWKIHQSCFSNIVHAIGNSGLRHSLTKLDISDNQTLSKEIVQKLLNANGMTNISVIYSESEELLPVCEILDY